VTELNNILYEDLIFLKKSFRDRNEVIEFLAERMREKGLVKESFLSNVLKREEKFPTGLLIGDINVAIPHTDTGYAIKPAISVVTLKNPVKFYRMDEPNEEIDVHIVFLLSVLDPKQYVNFLARLTRSFSKGDFLKSLYNTKDKKEVLDKLSELTKEE